MFTSFLLEKLSHLKGIYKTEDEFVKHLMTGEVQIPITDAIRFQQEYADKESNSLKLPSGHQHGEFVWLCLWSNEIAAEVLNTHFFGEEGKVKYDLILLGDDGQTTRVYNVDSAFVSKFSRKDPSKERLL